MGAVHGQVSLVISEGSLTTTRLIRTKKLCNIIDLDLGGPFLTTRARCPGNLMFQQPGLHGALHGSATPSPINVAADRISDE